LVSVTKDVFLPR